MDNARICRPPAMAEDLPMANERHASYDSASAAPRIDRKIYMMGTALGGVEAGEAELATCLPAIKNELIRAEIGQVAEEVRLVAASLRERFEKLARAGDGADAAVAFALAVEDLRGGVRQIAEQVDAAEEIAGGIGVGTVSESLIQIRQATEVFWHLYVLLLRQWAAKGVIDIKFED
jgi:hypothetical protein